MISFEISIVTRRKGWVTRRKGVATRRKGVAIGGYRMFREYNYSKNKCAKYFAHIEMLT